MNVYINARFLTQHITGVQQFAYEICRNLKSTSVNYVLLAPRGVNQPTDLHHLGFQNIGRANGYIWEQVELPRFLKRQGEPLLLNFCNTAPLLYRNQWVTIHDLAFMHHPEWFSKNFARVYRFLIPRIAKRSRKILTVSQTIRHQIHRLLGVDDVKIEVLYNGIHHEMLNYTETKSITRKPFILAVSSINPRKNLRFLIQAFEQSGLTNHQLIVVGAGNAVFGRQEIAIPNRVTFAGYLPNNELIRLYHEAALFISFSHDEGFGIPVLEALYCGCPVLLSDIEVYRECFSDVASFTSLSSEAEAAVEMRRCIENTKTIQVPTPLFQQYNYEYSAKKLNDLVEESLK